MKTVEEGREGREVRERGREVQTNPPLDLKGGLNFSFQRGVKPTLLSFTGVGGWVEGRGLKGV